MPQPKEYFAMKEVLLNFGIECWLKRFMENPTIYQEFRTHFKTIVPSPRRPINTWKDEAIEFAGWLATHYRNEYKYLLFISKYTDSRLEATYMISKYYLQWRETAKADRDEEL